MWVKICGIRDVETARAVADLRPDAIGLNFFPQSPRYVDVRMAERICRALPVDVEPIAVFVNHDADDIQSICKHCRITTVQLHGDETPDDAVRIAEQGLEVIRALRVDAAAIAQLPQAIADHNAASLRGVLVDSRTAGQYGGTGVTAPWDPLAAAWKGDWPPLILAGGLTPANVAQAIRAVGPWGVDTASGVESSPGIKDLSLVQDFITAARQSGTP
jgi:phosphoribosylanthranilate isomerase